MPLTLMILLLVDRSSISAMASSGKVRRMSEDPAMSPELLRMVSMVLDLLSRVLILLWNRLLLNSVKMKLNLLQRWKKVGVDS